MLTRLYIYIYIRRYLFWAIYKYRCMQVCTWALTLSSLYMQELVLSSQFTFGYWLPLLYTWVMPVSSLHDLHTRMGPVSECLRHWVSESAHADSNILVPGARCINGMLLGSYKVQPISTHVSLMWSSMGRPKVTRKVIQGQTKVRVVWAWAGLG